MGPEVSATLEGMGAMLRHGYTYSGHPAACVAGLKNIELIEEWGLVERATHIGELFKSGFDSLVADGAILSYRGVGAIWAAKLPYEAAEVRVRMLDRGVVIRPILDAVAFCPPLTSTDAEIGQMIDVMADSLNK